MLIATSGCIGAGLDCSDVVLVLRDGFLTSMIDLIQEMGCCGRSRPTNNDNIIGIHDCFHLIISLPSITYLIEGIYASTLLSKKRIRIEREHYYDYRIEITTIK